MALANLHLTPQLIQAVRDSVDILEVASAVTRLEKRGNRYWGLCPFHKEKTPSFSLDPTRGLYYCFGCGAGGDAIRLHMQTSGDDFPAAIETLARSYGIPLPSVRSTGKSGPDPEEILSAAAELFEAELGRSRKATAYLAERRLPAEVVKQFRLGYAPDRFDFLTSALGSRFRTRDLEAAGLVATKEDKSRSWDRFRDRLMFPIFGPSGRIVGFGGRTLGQDRAKYVNTPETERFQKRSLLYGLHLARKAIRERGAMVLVEGYFDLLALVASGVEWVGASMGTSLTPEQARLAARYAEEVVVAYDADSAGEEASRRALPILLQQGLRVKRLHLPAGDDPDSFRLRSGESSLQAAVEQAVDAIDLEIDRVPAGDGVDPHTVARSAKWLRQLLGAVSDPVVRYAYGRRAADRLRIPPELLSAAGVETPRPGGPRPTAGAAARGVGPPTAGTGPRQVQSLEERVLQLLLSGEAPVPPLDQLPPPEVFLDPACGNIFSSFRAMYAAGGVPDAKSVLAALGDSPGTLDRAARILLETPSCSEADGGELLDSLRRLTRRWQRDRLKRLVLDIRDAQRRGDLARLDALIQEKDTLTRALHDLEA